MSISQNRFDHWVCIMCLAVLATLSAVTHAQAQAPDLIPETASEPAPLPPLALGYKDDAFAAYVDGVVDEAMHEAHAAGLSLAIVRGGEIRLLKGYGFANIEEQIPVDPTLHTFRIGSVGKTFTHIMAMQLVDQGRLDLEADVNDYLTAFKIPAAYDTPVKIKDLLSHRSGFDDVLNDLFVENGDAFMSLEDWLKGNIPARVRPPGTLSNYDNYGVALLGYIVQEVSGTPYEDLVEQKILKPLGMDNSTARQKANKDDPRNMPATLAANTTVPYFWQNGRFVSTPFELVPAAPAGAMSSTAADMARYMLANLNGMTLDGARLLSPEAAIAIRERLYPGRPGADFAHGFRNGKFAGYDTFEHGGATQASFTTMILVPELDIGVFASTNGTQNGTQPQAQIVDRILDKMIGAEARPRPARLELENAEAYAGSYIATRRTFQNAFKILTLAGGTASVAATDRGTLLVLAGGEASEYERIAEHTFQKLDSNDVITFNMSDSGRATRFHVPYGHVAMERMTGDASASGFILIASLAFLFALTQFISAWKRRSDAKTGTNAWSFRLSVIGLMAAGLVVLTLVLTSLTLIEISSLGNKMLFAWPVGSLKVLNWATLLLALLTGLTMLGIYPALTKAGFSTWRKIHFVIFVLVLVLFVLKLNDWNLIGFRY